MMSTNYKAANYALLLIAGGLLSVSASYGQAGTFLGKTTFDINCGFTSSTGHSDGFGISFDGKNMWYSCYDSKNSNDSLHRDLFKANAKTGAVLGGWDVAGGMGAIAYDASRNVIWAGEGGGLSSNVGWIIEIPLDSSGNASNGGYIQAFKVPEAYASPPQTEDSVDGLAIDATSGVLYVHYDFATEFEMYSTNSSNFGAFLGYAQEAPGIPSGTPVITPQPGANGQCVLSGLAVGGNTIFEASDYCDYVWAVDQSNPQNEDTTNSFSIASIVPTSSFDEKSLTCDTVTFPGHDTLWVKDVFTPQPYAFDVLPGTCGVGGEPPPYASLSPTSVNFGNVQVGATSAAQTVTLANSGGSALSFSSIVITGTSSGDFAQTNNCGSILAAGNNCTINVTFTPTASGTRNASLTVSDNASVTPQTVSLTGTGSNGTAAVSPVSLTFSSQPDGTTSAAQTVTLSNTSSVAVSIASIAISGTNSGDFAQTSNCPSSLPASSKCTINVTFTPSLGATETAMLTVTDTATNSPQTASLTGTGVAPTAALSPTSLTFSSQNVGTTSAAQAVTLKNSGGTALSISSIAVTGTNSGDFAQTNNCGTSLAASSSCTINVTFTPTATGTRTATLSVTDNASGSPQTASLSGTGASTSVTLSPALLSFGNQAVGTTSASQALTLATPRPRR